MKRVRILIAVPLVALGVLGAPHIYNAFSDFKTMGREVAQDQKQSERQAHKTPSQRLLEAEYQLGLMSEYGIGVKQDPQEAYFWFSVCYNKAAKQRVSQNLTPSQISTIDTRAVKWDLPGMVSNPAKASADALYLIGSLYRSGNLGVEANQQEASNWFRKAADAGHIQAQYLTGQGYQQNDNPTEAIKWLRMAAEQGNADAQFSLGNMYWRGWHVPQDYAEAVKWSRMAADQGNKEAQTIMGQIYEQGGLGIQKDPLEADKWFRKALEPAEALKEEMKSGDSNAMPALKTLAEKGDAGAQDQLGSMYYWGDGVEKNYLEAMKWYRLAADKGEPEAMRWLGKLYYDGGPNLPEDRTEAHKWYGMAAQELQKEAEQDKVDAQYELGMAYVREGSGIDQNFAEALKWLRKAADQNYAPAEFAYGGMYENGFGLPQDYKETLKWWLKAANHGGVEAQHALATVYRYGKDDFKQDYMEAFFWELVWAKTHKNDLESMREAYDLSGASNLSTDQVASVYKRVAEWRPQADLSVH